MTEVIAQPNTVKAVIPFLAGRLTARSMPTFVGGAIPTTRPSRYVRVSQIGGSRPNVAQFQTLLLVECFAPTQSEADDVAIVCTAELEAAARSPDPIAAGLWLSGSPDDFGQPVAFPDPLTSTPRAQFTCTLTVTGKAI